MSQADTGDVIATPAPALPLAETPARQESDRALLRYLLILSLPVVGEQLLSMTVGLTDVWLAGHLGAQTADATAAVGSISYFLWLVGLITGTINGGSMAIIARAIGARHRSLANKVSGQTITAALIMGVILAALLLLFAEPLARMTGLPDASREMALLYLRILAFSLPFSTLIFAGNACLRGAGDTVTPAIVMITVDGTNAILSASLTRGWLGLPALGFKGIAFGTLSAYIIGGTFLFIILLSGYGRIKLYMHRMRPHWHTLKRILRIGIPSGLEGTLQWGAQFIVLGIINRSGGGASISGAAHALAVRVESFSFLLGFAVAIACATTVGQSLGMRDARRATRAAWLAFMVGGGIMVTMGIAFIFRPHAFTSVFTTDPAVADLAAKCLIPAGFAQAGFAASLIFGGALRGAGDTLTVMRITLSSVFGLRLLGALIVGAWLHMGVEKIWIVLCAELTLRGVVILLCFLRGKWKTVKV